MIGLGLRAQPSAQWWPDGAVYAADFTMDRYMIDGVAVPRSAAFTFTRNSTKLAQDSQGNWHQFGTDMPAITDRGLLLEPERHNSVINSTTLEWWNLLRASVTPNAGPGLLPGHGADLLTATENNVNGAFAGTNAQTVVPGTIYTFSTILRRANTDWIGLVVSTNDNSHRKSCWFNLANATTGATQTVGSEIIVHTSGVQLLPGSLLRPWVSISTETVSNPIFRVYMFDGDGAFTVTSGADVSLLHGQLELGSDATTPIVATETGLTRRADTLILQLPQTSDVHIAYRDGSEAIVPNASMDFPVPNVPNCSIAGILAY